MIKKVLSYLFVCFPVLCIAQGKEHSLGFGLHSHGLHLFYKKFNGQKTGLMNAWRFEIGNRNHEKEIALINGQLPGTTPFKLEKINYAWYIRPSIEKKIPLFHAESRKSIGAGIVINASVPVHYLWPMYIKYFRPDLGDNEYMEVQYDPAVHKPDLIAGKTIWWKGFNEGQFIPGIGLQSGLEFTGGGYIFRNYTIGIGSRLDFFARKVPILYNPATRKQIFADFYINFALTFGR